MGPSLARKIGVQDVEMIDIRMDAKGIDGTSLKIVGGIPIKLGINLENNGELRETRQLVYVVPGIEQPLVNRSALCDLGLLPNLWPPRCVETRMMPMKYNEERVQLSTELETKTDGMLELRRGG